MFVKYLVFIPCCFHWKDKELIIPGKAAIYPEVDGIGQNYTEGRNEDQYLCNIIVQEFMKTEIQTTLFLSQRLLTAHLEEMACNMMRTESGISTMRKTMLRMINMKVVLLVLFTLVLVDSSPD